MTTMRDLLMGSVVETRTGTWMGSLFYSDNLRDYRKTSLLNELTGIPIIGIAAGVVRMALAVIHSVGHLFAALITWDKGHCYHAAKGGCEFLRGLIEAIPFAGRSFARWYNEDGDWWILKIYNPDAPDSLDRHRHLWRNLRENRPTGYVVA